MKLFNEICNIKSFKQFITKNINPSETVYGTNLKDKKWLTIPMPNKGKWKSVIPYSSYFKCTFFEYDGIYYMISICKEGKNIDVSFALSDIFSMKIMNSNILEAKIQFIEQFFDFNSMRLNNAQTIFNKVLYVILEGCEELNIKSFRFKPATSKLGLFYNKILKNSNNQKTLESYRLVYIGESDSMFLFKIKL